MKIEDLKPGVRVAELMVKYNVYEDDTSRGTVLSIIDNNTVKVEWDTDWNGKSYIENINIADLMLEADVAVTRNRLEKEYSELKGKVAIKVREAADLIQEANEIVVSAGYDQLSDLYEITSPLIRAIDVGGWSSSFMNC